MGVNLDCDFDFGDDFETNPFNGHITQSIFDQQIQNEATISISSEELGLNQPNSNPKIPNNALESSDSGAHGSSTFPSFPLNEVFGPSNNGYQQNNNLLGNDEHPFQNQENTNIVFGSANADNEDVAFATATANQITNFAAASAFPGFDMTLNPQQARPSFLNTTITTTQQCPQATTYNGFSTNPNQQNGNAVQLQPQNMFQPSNVQQMFQPIISSSQQHILQPQQMFSPTASGYGFQYMHQNQQSGNVAQPQQMLQQSRMHQDLQNVFPGNVHQPQQVLMAQQMNQHSQSTLNNQLFSNFNYFQSSTSQYPNWFPQNMNGGTKRQSSLYGSQQLGPLLNNSNLNHSSSFRSQDLSGQFNHLQAQMIPNMLNPQINMPVSPMHSGPQQSFHQQHPGRPVGLFPQGPYPIKHQHSMSFRPSYVPQQILMVANANNPQSSSSNSSHENQNPLSIFLAEIDNSRLDNPRSPCFQLRLPNSPILSRRGQLLNNPQEPNQALSSRDLVNKRQQNVTTIKDRPIIPRAREVADDQQLVDVPILARDSEKENSLLPGQPSKPSPRTQTIEVEAVHVHLEDYSPISSQKSRVEKEHDSDDETGSLATDNPETERAALKGKKIECRKHVAEQFASRDFSEQVGIGADTRSRKKAKRAYDGSSTSVPPNHSEQNGSHNSLFPPRKKIDNKVYDLNYEVIGLPVDPHLRMFVSRKK